MLLNCHIPDPTLWASCECVKLLQSCLTLWDLMNQNLPGSSVHGIFPGINTGVGCPALFQGIFPTQGLNLHLLCLLHWQTDSLLPAPPGKPMSKSPSNKSIHWLYEAACLVFQSHFSGHFSLLISVVTFHSLHPPTIVFYLFVFKTLFIHLFILGCAGSWLLHAGIL